MGADGWVRLPIHYRVRLLEAGAGLFLVNISSILAFPIPVSAVQITVLFALTFQVLYLLAVTLPKLPAFLAPVRWVVTEIVWVRYAALSADIPAAGRAYAPGAIEEALGPPATVTGADVSRHGISDLFSRHQ